jgi:hypothetical protein
MHSDLGIVSAIVILSVLYCHVIDWLLTGFRLLIGFIEHLQNVTTNNYDSLSYTLQRAL